MKTSLLSNTLYTMDLLDEVKFLRSFGGRPAHYFEILGRRGSFTSTTVMNDVAEYLAAGSTALFGTLVGNEVLTIFSDSANDTSDGTGARTIKVVYVDNNNDMQQSSHIVLNGLTPVNCGFTANAILWMETFTGGSNETAIGNISLKAGGTTYEMITAGGNKSMSARFYVPRNFVALVSRLDGGAIASAQDMRLRATVSGFDRSLITRFVFQKNIYVPQNDSRKIDMALMFPPLSRIKVSTISGATVNARCDGGFNVHLIPAG